MKFDKLFKRLTEGGVPGNGHRVGAGSQNEQDAVNLVKTALASAGFKFSIPGSGDTEAGPTVTPETEKEFLDKLKDEASSVKGKAPIDTIKSTIESGSKHGEDPIYFPVAAKEFIKSDRAYGKIIGGEMVKIMDNLGLFKDEK